MPHHEQRKINNIGDHLIGIHCLFRQSMCHGVHIQVYPILVHGVIMILGWYVMTINILLMLSQGVMIYMIGHHGRIKIFVINIWSDVQKLK
jgi:hypothetical protein